MRDRKKENPIKLKRHDYEGNNSGYHPVDTKVLVLPDYIDEKSDGGIILHENTVTQNVLAVTEGYLVEWGGECFVDWKGTDLSQIKQGMRVVWAVYAGQMIDGDDGKQYRLINDTDIAAIRRD